jgi:aspartate/methionine/tyrosine aminotransferase
MDIIAKEINKVIEDSVIYSLLSNTGKHLFFPRGIVSQSAEAGEKAKKYNATVGMATDGKDPIFLPSVMKHFKDLQPSEIFSYAPTAGIMELRKIWKEEMIKKNLLLRNCETSLPVVTAGLTHGLSIAADLFIDKNDVVIIPDMMWGNYKLIVETKREGYVKNFSFFSDNRINVKAFEDAIITSGSKKIRIILNFPNNPTGYSPTANEVEEIVSMFYKLAGEGYKILVICDDAYFGLFFEDETFKESLFTKLCNLHNNIFAVKIDGSTKEELAWGFRVGFITYGGKGINKNQYDVLQQKTMGAIRASVSSCSNLSQNLLLKGIKSGSYQQEKDSAMKIMKDRYLKVKEVIADMPSDIPLRALPFNSGYFMTLEVKGKDSDKIRKALLDNYSTGIISLSGKYIRIAFSSVKTKDIPQLYNLIFKAVKES